MAKAQAPRNWRLTLAPRGGRDAVMRLCRFLPILSALVLAWPALGQSNLGGAQNVPPPRQAAPAPAPAAAPAAVPAATRLPWPACDCPGGRCCCAAGRFWPWALRCVAWGLAGGFTTGGRASDRWAGAGAGAGAAWRGGGTFCVPPRFDWPTAGAASTRAHRIGKRRRRCMTASLPPLGAKVKR